MRRIRLTQSISVLVGVVAAPAVALAEPSAIKVTSSAFTDNAPIPVEYTCQGAGTSPPLAWSGTPAGTKSIAIVAEDPDTAKGTFTHWLITGIKPTVTSIAQGASLPDGAVAAKNDKGTVGYTGPCPPSGRHRYFFRVYALDTTLDETAMQSKVDFFAASQGHVLAKGELVGTYQKHAK
ncbi:MAG TPA: YbhB/YbcL family Raf kinase inhibitor-like protein [Kofleriaceae bacterium]|nr:YbhB/YbcL family Raf kinase inhibitor-like protein [Kofleriaceae bacterium]